MTTSDLVKQMCQEEGMSIAALAKNLGQTRQNFYKKTAKRYFNTYGIKRNSKCAWSRF